MGRISVRWQVGRGAGEDAHEAVVSSGRERDRRTGRGRHKGVSRLAEGLGSGRRRLGPERGAVVHAFDSCMRGQYV